MSRNSANGTKEPRFRDPDIDATAQDVGAGTASQAACEWLVARLSKDIDEHTPCALARRLARAMPGYHEEPPEDIVKAIALFPPTIARALGFSSDGHLAPTRATIFWEGNALLNYRDLLLVRATELARDRK